MNLSSFFTCFAAILILILTTNCKNETNSSEIDLPVYLLTQKYDTIEINLDKHSKAINLFLPELTESSAISRTPRIIKTSKHVILGLGTSIILMDHTGNFEKVLASEGKGPNEINGYISVWAYEPIRKLFAYHSHSSKEISIYDVENHEFKPSIGIDHTRLCEMQFYDESTLLLAPLFPKFDGFVYKLVDLQGNTLFVENFLDTLENSGFAIVNNHFSGKLENKVFYKQHDIDTVYQIEHSTKTPVHVFVTDPDKIDGNKTTGERAKWLYYGDNYGIAEKSPFIHESDGSNHSIRGLPSILYYIDFNSSDIKHVKFSFNFYGIEMMVPYLRFYDQNKYFFMYDALDLKENLEEMISNSENHKENLDEVEKFMKTIDINSNPYFFFGELNREINFE